MKNFPKFIEKNNISICIPLLQRDYVQGGKSSVIIKFLDYLLAPEHPNLNYIYGYTEEKKFIPIDGQQRLITLWLLYVYAKGNDLSVELHFDSREFADDFCCELKKNISDLKKNNSNDNKSLKKDFNKIIEEQNWFLTSWKKNATVRNMLHTLKYIHIKCQNMQDGALEDKLNDVQFSFLNMEAHDLTDDTYIKMNARGKHLSMFENLKAWMDGQIRNIREKTYLEGWEKEKTYLEGWENKIDNEWTALIWKNRDKSKENIDDEQLFCFRNLLYLFWTEKENQCIKDNINNFIDNKTEKQEQLKEIFPNVDVNDINKVTEEVFNKLLEGDMLSTIWIERLNLMPKEFFIFASYALNQLYSLNSYLEDLRKDKPLYLYMGGTNDKKSHIYDLLLKKGSVNRTLPLLYSLIKAPICENNDNSDNSEKLFDWMRVCRNLIMNSDISFKNLPNVLNSLGSFSKEVEKSENIYDYLTNNDNDNDNKFLDLKGFNIRQKYEEVRKAKHILDSKDDYGLIKKMENEPFFLGSIRCVFMLLDHNDIQKYFKKCCNILMNIFTSDGVSSDYDGEDKLLRRTLMSIEPYYYGITYTGIGKGWCFCKTKGDWKEFLSNNKDWDNYFQQDCKSSNKAFQSFRNFINKLLTCKNVPKDSDRLTEVIKFCMEDSISKFEREFKNSSNNKTQLKPYHYCFVHYPKVWEYMRQSLCKEEPYYGDTKFVTLRKSITTNYIDIELYTIYLEYKELKNKKELNCCININESNNSLECSDKNNNNKVVISRNINNLKIEKSNFCIYVQEISIEDVITLIQYPITLNRGNYEVIQHDAFLTFLVNNIIDQKLIYKIWTVPARITYQS